MSQLSEALRWMFTLLGALAALLEPTLPYLGICTLLILADCYTAWSLSRRVRRAHPGRVSPGGRKFQSHRFGRVIGTLLKSYALILMAYLVGTYIADGIPVDLAKAAAGAVCFWQLWSILENESSCNGASWARVLQKILVDKTSRHFDIDLHGLEECDEPEASQAGGKEGEKE